MATELPGRTAAERGREVRQKLLSAATELIPELGWTAVSTRIVADRAGVAPGLVHYHFRSLQALLRSAAIGTMGQVLATARPLFADATTLDAGMDLLLGALDSYTGNDPVSLLFTEAYLAATRDDILRDGLATLVVEFRRDLSHWLSGLGQEAPDATASVLAAALDGMMLHRALNPDLTSAVVAPVLRKLLTPAISGTNDSDGGAD